MASPNPHPIGPAEMPAFLKNAIVALIRSRERDLSARQFSVFLTCCTLPEPHTVRGLARQLKVAKPAITRAVDRLEIAGLVRRKPDIADRRSVNVVPTPTGLAFLTRLESSLTDAATMAPAARLGPPGRHRRIRQRDALRGHAP